MVKALVALFTRAWIEMLFELHVSPEGAKSPSSRGRGLKSLDSRSKYTYRPVALFTRAWIEIFLLNFMLSQDNCRPLHEGVD